MISTNFPDLGTAIDTRMAVYSLQGNDCIVYSLVEVACNATEMPTSSSERFASIGAELTAGEMYYVQVAEEFFFGESMDLGTFCIQIEELQPPANDEVCDAIALELDADPIEFSNVGATSNFEFGLAPAPNPGDIAGVSSWGLGFGITHSIWFSFVAPESGVVDLDLSGLDVIGNFNSKIAVYEADDCSSVSGANGIAAQASYFSINPPNYTGGAIFFTSRIEELPCLIPGQTYYVLVDGNSDFLFQPSSSIGRGLSAVRTVTPAPLSFEESVMDAGCAGENRGAVNVVGTGGSSGRYANNGNSTAPQYSYEWSNGETGRNIDSLSAGTYTVTMTDVCGGTLEKSFEVTENPGPTVLVSEDETVMAGDAVELFSLGQLGSPFDTLRMFYVTNNGFGPPSGRVMRYNLRSEDQPVAIAGDTLPGYAHITYGNGKLYTTHRISDPVTFDPLYVVSAGEIATGIMEEIATLSFPDIFSTPDIQFNRYTNEPWLMTSAGDMYVVDAAAGTATFAFNVDVAFARQFVIVDEETIIVSSEDSENERFASLHAIDLNSGDVLASVVAPAQPNAMDIAIDPGTPDVYLLAHKSPTAAFADTFREYWHLSLETGEFTPVRMHPTGFPVAVDFTIAPRTVDGYDYVWTPAANLDDATIPDPVATVEETTTFQVQISDACGSTANGDVALTVVEPEADLELSITSSLTEYKIWEIVPYTITLTNKRGSDATNVKVAAGLPSGMVHTSNNALTGSYNLYFEEWTIPLLASGQTATLELVLFPLVQDVDLTNFVQVLTSDQNDPDSTPGNDTDQTPDEDDEAALTLANGNNRPAVGIQKSIIGKATLFPSPATTRLTLALHSEVEGVQLMRIYDVQGQVLLEKEVGLFNGNNVVNFDIENLNAGSYFLWTGEHGELLKFSKM